MDFKKITIPKTKVVILSFLITFSFTSMFLSCKKEGCTDSKALNKDYDANKDNGSCVYSDATFYASAGYYNGIAIVKIDVTIDGNYVGYIPGTYYPSGPGNCSATGTVPYKFQSGSSVDWNTTVYLVSGGTIYGSGQVSPSSVQECVKVNVTR